MWLQAASSPPWPRFDPTAAGGLWAWALLGIVAIGAAARALASPKDRFRRGTRLTRGPGPFRRRLAGGELSIAGVAVRARDETKHFKIIGTTGTGKSTAIRELLSGALARGDRAVFADPDGGYQARFFDRYRGDTVLNPFEADSVRWDLFGEIRDRFDVEQVAGGLIPDSEDVSANEWRGYARTLLSAVIRRCAEQHMEDAANLWRLLMIAPPDELRPLVAGTPAQPFLDIENLRMFSSIRSVMGSSLAAFEYVQRQRAHSFSIREWVRDSRRRGALFIPYRANQIQALRSMIAAWMHLAIFESMSGDESRDQRLWFVVDELDALGAVHGLKDALARLRKFGGRCVLGFQAISQVSSTYGTGIARALVENCGNTLILRCSAGESGGTSEFASRLIGEREIVRRQLTRGSDREAMLSLHGSRRSRTVNEQHVTEPAVMPSELEQLPDLVGYFKGASSARWLRVDFRRRRAAAWQERMRARRQGARDCPRRSI